MHGDASGTEADQPYLVRLVARIPQPLSRRLKMHATLSGSTVTQALTEVLGQALPTADQLAEQMRGPGR